MSASSTHDTVHVRSVYKAWWPLAASWLFMGLELPAVGAVLARLADPEIHLAAYGGVVFPVALLIESPIIMILAASTALCKDWASYRLVRRYMFLMGGALTVLHVAIAFTPLYDVLIGGLLGPPAEVLEPARVGLQIMTPWTMAIAYRRYQHGVLIRFGHSKAVGIGTLVRLIGNVAVLAAGYAIGGIPGIVVGTLAVAIGVTAEAIYAGFRVHPVLRDQVRPAKPIEPALTPAAFWHFYTPLLLTPVFMLIVIPMASAAMSRMPRAIDSLAVWPVLNGLVFLFRSTGFAFNEVVVAMVDRRGAVVALRRFAFGLAAIASFVLFVMAATPVGDFWFGPVAALSTELRTIASTALWIAFMLPAFSVIQSLYQGAIVHSRKTRAITESVLILITVAGTLLGIGIMMGSVIGLYVALFATVTGNGLQAAWLWFRSRRTMRELQSLDPTVRAEAVGATAG